MARLLVVHHTTSPALQELLEAALTGARTPEAGGGEAGGGEAGGIEVVTRPALTATAVDVLGADAVLLGTPANIGYMSGALKHFFDTIYYPCLTDTAGLAYGVYVHGNNDTTGAIRAVESIAAGLSWVAARPAVSVIGTPGPADREACWDLGALCAYGAAQRSA